MAAIKIQSLNDIVAAYLKTINVSEAFVPEWVAKVEQEGDVIASLDRLLLPAAEQLYPEKKFDKHQKIAGFKLAWLSLGFSELHPGQKIDEEILDELKKVRFNPAPEYKMQKMIPQPLEMPRLHWSNRKN